MPATPYRAGFWFDGVLAGDGWHGWLLALGRSPACLLTGRFWAESCRFFWLASSPSIILKVQKSGCFIKAN